MKIGLIDADLMDHGTRHPNLALMKISGYYKEKGEDVELIYKDYSQVNDYDEVYISKVFSFSEVPEEILKLDHVKIGGTGFFEDGGENLPYEIEHHMPDYELYKPWIESELDRGMKKSHFEDYLDYSIGFTTRGCFRKCSFCVNKKYDRVHRHSPVSEFLNKDRKYIYLWDDNILAYPKWEEVLDDLEATGKRFQFRQGIDLRLMTDKKAKRFVKTKYKGDFIFAFDHLKDREIIEEKVQLWKKYSAKICKMYVLSAYDSQDERDIESVFLRIKILMQYGSLPYIMRYEAYKKSKYRSLYVQIARWCNQPRFFKKMSFREFCIANQEYKKDKSTKCSALVAMESFEEEHLEIAKKYFDLKFEEENMYSEQYGYGRKYANKGLCSECKRNGNCWLDLINEEKIEEIIEKYYTREIDLECLIYKNSYCRQYKEKILEKFIKILNSMEIRDIIKIIKDKDFDESESILVERTLNCAQDLINNKLDVLDEIRETNKTKYTKLTKSLVLIDLLKTNKNMNISDAKLSELCKKIISIEDKKEREKILKRVLLRIPKIRRVLKDYIETNELAEAFRRNEIKSKNEKEYLKDIIFQILYSKE